MGDYNDNDNKENGGSQAAEALGLTLSAETVVRLRPGVAVGRAPPGVNFS